MKRSNPAAVLHGPPEVVCVKVSRELGVDLYNMDIALCRVPDDGLVVFSRRLVRLDVNAERAVEFEFQSRLNC